MQRQHNILTAEASVILLQMSTLNMLKEQNDNVVCLTCVCVCVCNVINTCTCIQGTYKSAFHIILLLPYRYCEAHNFREIHQMKAEIDPEMLAYSFAVHRLESK